MSQRWVKCPRDGHTWQTKSTLAWVTCPHCRLKMNLEANLVDEEIAIMRHFNLDESGIRVLDPSLATKQSPNGRIIDVYFKGRKVWCEYDESSTCKHVQFALSLPIVQEILKKKGWKT